MGSNEVDIVWSEFDDASDPGFVRHFIRGTLPNGAYLQTWITDEKDERIKEIAKDMIASSLRRL